MQWITAIILAGILVIQEFRHERERKDLYNRIMSKDLQDYKQESKCRSVPSMIKKHMDKVKNDQKE